MDTDRSKKTGNRCNMSGFNTGSNNMLIKYTNTKHPDYKAERYCIEYKSGREFSLCRDMFFTK